MYSEQSHTLPEAAIQTSAPPLLASSTFVNQPPSQSLLNPLPAQAINFTVPAEDDEDWPPPPPPVTDEFIEESRPLPPEKLVSELTELLRDTRTSSQEQPRYISPHHPPQARTPEYCTPFTLGLRVRALVDLLEQLGESGQTELCCGSHVTRLLSKLPQDMRAQFKRFLYPMRVTIPTLLHFSDWLDYELKMQETVYESLHSGVKSSEHRAARLQDSKVNKPTSILHTADKPSDTPPAEQTSTPNKTEKSAFCPYQDQEAIQLLEAKTTRVDIHRVLSKVLFSKVCEDFVPHLGVDILHFAFSALFTIGTKEYIK
uniref:Uncharacterized protein n=1 Tax=Knipowitschia caucasica TaxID=637954 RepID=A0AAV2M2J7_KNICA